MPLQDLVDASAEVEVGGTTVKVYPITILHFTTLLKEHESEITAAFNSQKSWHELATIAPELAAKVIAIGCREPGMVKKVLNNVGLATQAELLRQITKVTIPSEEQFADFFRVVIQTIPSLVGRLGQESPRKSKTPPKKDGSSSSKEQSET